MTERFYVGAIFGDLTLRQRVRENLNHSSNIRKRWRAQCSCGVTITVPEWYLIRQPNPKTHCGCKRKTSKTIYNQEYRIWLLMNKRCTDPKHVSFEYYGKRGIKVCPEWADPNSGFEAFIKFVGPRPSAEHSIDRVDNDGNYEPFHPITGKRQVRWATADEQAANKGRKWSKPKAVQPEAKPC